MWNTKVKHKNGTGDPQLTFTRQKLYHSYFSIAWMCVHVHFLPPLATYRGLLRFLLFIIIFFNIFGDNKDFVKYIRFHDFTNILKYQFFFYFLDVCEIQKIKIFYNILVLPWKFKKRKKIAIIHHVWLRKE